jgi:hypothetical protein
MLREALAPLRRWQRRMTLPAAARVAIRSDRENARRHDPGGELAIDAALDWLSRAQDNSTSQDGGVARHYSIISGWGASYPETTGYIIPTMLAQARRRDRQDLAGRARRMLDWLVSIQFPDGGFQGGMVDQQPRVPVTFNTGQILLGLAAGVQELGDAYREPMRRAADWLVATQDPDGKWSRHPTPFAAPGLKTYETHVAWGLFEAARHERESPWGEAGLRQVRWAIGQLRPDGWPEHCCLEDPTAPLTHTLGYTLRGLLEAWRFSRQEAFLDAGLRLGRSLLACLGPEGRLAGRLRADWSPAVDWVCLTGTVQIAHCWLILFEETGEERWREAARAANGFVRRTVALDGPLETRGAVAGSSPIDGGYGTLQYLNWAAKFAIDAWQLELDCDTGISPERFRRAPA